MLIYSDAKALAHHIQISVSPQAIVGVDGWTGVGKTTLAAAIATAIDAANVDLDAFLERDRGCYVEAIRFDDLKANLFAERRPVIVSGICLREILARMDFAPNFNIYVKRMATWGWADEEELHGSIPEVDPSGGGAQMRREMRAYHQKWQPHERADCEFHRTGNEGL